MTIDLPQDFGTADRTHLTATWDAIASWSSRHNAILTIAAACTAPVMYLLYVNHFSVNVLQGDDWNMIPLGIDGALHGHLSLSHLWSQYAGSRILLVRLIYVLFGFFDRLNTRSMVLLDAVIYIAAFAVLLTLFRHYIRRRLTPIPVLVIGLIWFSLADVQTALWAFQISWFLVLLFFLAMLYVLLIPQSRRTLWFAVAIVLALLASMSFVQGFVAWPLGAICILWGRSLTRREAIEIGIWISATILTCSIYFYGFNFSSVGCYPIFGCTPGVAYSHPLKALQFLILLVGNVIPGGYFGEPHASLNLLRFEIVGGVLLAVAIFIIVQTWRHRRSGCPFPLPFLLIAFGLLVDVMITLGRTGGGPFSALNSNRYVIANLIVLTGIVIYAFAHLHPFRLPTAHRGMTDYLTWLAMLSIAVLLSVQVVVSTRFGLNNGHLDRVWQVDGARLAVNINRLPTGERLFEQSQLFIPPLDIVRVAAKDQLSEFQPNQYRYYRRLGPPSLSPSRATHSK